MKFLVIGDLMIDRYMVGDVKRISAEAPVPVVDIKVVYDVLGGAANCASNITSLAGPDSVDIVGYLGDDSDGLIIQKLLDDEKISFRGWTTSTKPTIIKERLFAAGQQLIRADIEDKKDMMFDRALWVSIDFESYDYIVVSDYAKGTVNRELMDYLAPYANKILIDPKPENWANYPPGVLMVTPNEYEHKKMLYRQPELPQYILVTKGRNGMTLHTDQWSKDIKGEDIENCEVIGAGDTVIATIAVCLAENVTTSMVDVVRVANECARYVVTQKGTSVVPRTVYDNVISCLIHGEDL